MTKDREQVGYLAPNPHPRRKGGLALFKMDGTLSSGCREDEVEAFKAEIEKNGFEIVGNDVFKR